MHLDTRQGFLFNRSLNGTSTKSQEKIICTHNSFHFKWLVNTAYSLRRFGISASQMSFFCSFLQNKPAIFYCNLNFWPIKILRWNYLLCKSRQFFPLSEPWQIVYTLCWGNCKPGFAINTWLSTHMLKLWKLFGSLKSHFALLLFGKSPWLSLLPTIKPNNNIIILMGKWPAQVIAFSSATYSLVPLLCWLCSACRFKSRNGHQLDYLTWGRRIRYSLEPKFPLFGHVSSSVTTTPLLPLPKNITQCFNNPSTLSTNLFWVRWRAEKFFPIIQSPLVWSLNACVVLSLLLGILIFFLRSDSS